MDRKAGYKECPRCGLRNKPSALQCDFCGLRFIAGEDWDDDIQALEKMGVEDEKVTVDEDVSKRIEATIVKREKINAPAKTQEPEKDDFDYFKKEPEPVEYVPVPVAEPIVTVAQEAVIETAPEPHPAVTDTGPVSLPPTPERIVIPENIPVEAAPARMPVIEKKVVRRVVRPAPKVLRSARNPMRGTAFTAALAFGVAMYLWTIMFGDSSMGRTGGWVLITLSTLMVVAGAGELFIGKAETKEAFAEMPPPKEQTRQDVLICPKCHELVTASERNCPDCGTEFRSE